MSEVELYVPEIRERHKRSVKIVEFTHSSTIAAAVMLFFAIAAVVIANTDLYEGYLAIWETPLIVAAGSFSFEMSFGTFINDGLMAIFFLTVGLEIKYEVTVGQLTDIRKALLPILAAAGGVLAPIGIYCLFNNGTPNAHGWGVPTATDIAFALGVLSLLGNRVPTGLKVFLSTLAIADDIIAIIVIAVFYGHTPSIPWMLAAAVVLVALMLLNRANVYQIRYYLLLGLVLWFCVYQSGLHATLAGVMLAFTIPAKSPVNPAAFRKWATKNLEDARENFDTTRPVLAQGEYIDMVDTISKVANYLTPPLSTLEKAIHSFTNFVILPLFALSNAGVHLVGADPALLLTNTATLGVFCGLVFGKPIGILCMSWLTVKLKLSDLPSGTNWKHIVGAAILGGVGFTMAIFVSNLAYTDAVTTTAAKAAILAASVVAGVAGYLFLLHEAKKTAQAEEELEHLAQQDAFADDGIRDV